MKICYVNLKRNSIYFHVDMPLISIIAFHDIIFLKATSINHVGERLRRILQKSLLLHKNDPQKGGLIYECLKLNSHNLGGTWEFDSYLEGCVR